MGRGGVRRETYARGQRLAQAAHTLVTEHDQAAARVRSHAAVLREREVGQALGAIPVARLRDVTEGRLRVTALEAAGFRTVAHVRRATPYELLCVPGIGRQTAAQAHAAAAQLARAAAESTAVRIDADRPDPAQQALIEALFPFVEAGPALRTAHAGAVDTAGRLDALLAAARPARSPLRLLLTGRTRRTAALRAVTELQELLAGAERADLAESFVQATADLLRRPASPHHGWLEFATRPAEYYTVLADIADAGPADTASTEGHLPDSLAAQVRAQQLDESLLRVRLRGYQSFGARYALSRRRTILGDEMGLGKTVQALAALAHLAALGETHFLVVCPTGVLVNWLRETEARTRLHAFRLHGPERDAGFAAWQQAGGVGVTTFDTLHRLAAASAPPPPAMLVVDEAHFVKNPATLRSRTIGAWADRTERVLFLTGTPMENRVEEFRALVGHLQPDLLPAVRGLDAAAGAGAFRRAVAPVYLRRNQQDVLTELPEAVHYDEWQEFSAQDAAAYRDAVAQRNFMAMRRAAYAHPSHSAKLRRLLEIVAEAREAGEKVIVFSFFRDVLTAVHQALAEAGAAVLGPLSGATGATARQETADRFADAAGSTVLLSQIQAGGVGLNLQAGSVVVLCEPQIKPALEQQAVARAHRMGQIRRVRVHRLLTPDSVDQRLLALLGAKERLFDAYARRSEVAETHAEALDVSERSLAQRIVEEEQLRLAGVQV